MIHGINKQWKDSREQTPQKRRRRHRAGRIALKGIDQVIERRLKDREEAEPQHRGTDTRRDPRIGLRRRPAKDEEPRSEEDGSEHHGRQPGFRHGFVPISREPVIVVPIVRDIDATAQDNSRQDSEERQGADEGVPAAAFLEGDGEGGEGGVEQAVAEGGVDGDGEADGGAEHLEGPHAEFVEHFRERDVPLFEAGVQAPVAGGDAQTTRFVDQEAGRVGFVEDKEVEEEDRHLEDAG